MKATPRHALDCPTQPIAQAPAPRRPRLLGPASTALAGAALFLFGVHLPASGAEPGDTGASTAALLLAALVCGLGLGWLTGWVAGRALEHRRLGAALRQACADQRRAERLQEPVWRWQTDAQHRLQTWQQPGTAAVGAAALPAEHPSGPPPPDRAFDPACGDAGLRAALTTQRAFATLRVLTDDAGTQGWRLRAEPREDEFGRFAGFDGLAEPTSEDDRQQVAHAALAGLLQMAEQPVVVARWQGANWVLWQHNEAALPLIGDLQPGSALLPPPAGLPAQALSGGLRLPRQRPSVVEGWRVTVWASQADANPVMLLARLAPGLPPAPASSADVDSFSYTVTHDLRAPIRVVEGFTRIVKEDYGSLLDRVGNDHLDRVLAAAARMNLMIDALLSLARLASQPLERQAVNLSQVAHYIVDDLRRGAPEREATVDIEPGLIAMGDATLLRLVLENLLGNAWKYSARAPQAHIHFCRVVQDKGDAFVVRDNGAGFDMRSADRLFGLFQRLHSASEFPGTGVGLASVRRIVQRHGGRVWAESEPGLGAAFYFSLEA